MTTENLQQLYDETALKFDEYNTEKASLEAESVIIEGLEADLEEARKTYDIAETKRLTDILEKSKPVHKTMVKDLDELEKSIKLELNGDRGDDLAYQVRKAARLDQSAVNKSLEIQGKLEEKEGLIQQIGIIEQELKQESELIFSKIRSKSAGFRPFLKNKKEDSHRLMGSGTPQIFTKI